MVLNIIPFASKVQYSKTVRLRLSRLCWPSEVNESTGTDLLQGI